MIKRTLSCIGTLLLGASILPAQDARLADTWKAEEFRQFDFWIGKWDVNLRTQQPDGTWKDSVAAKTEIYRILDGKAILELWDSKPIKGFSLRYFDPAKKKWVLYLNWPGGNRSSISSLEGSFRHGRGEFFSGPPLGDASAQISRYTFCDITPESLRWDDAYSSDGGKTWSNNWVMEFSRTAAQASWPADSVAHTFDDGTRCTGEPFDALNSMAGRWQGIAKVAQPSGETAMQAHMRIYNVLDGCSILRFLTLDTGQGIFRSFGLLTYNSELGKYEELSFDNSKDSVAQIYRGSSTGDTLTLDTTRPSDATAKFRQHRWSPPGDDDQILLESLTSADGSHWESSTKILFTRVPEAEQGSPDVLQPQNPTPMPLAPVILNDRCPRSGKLISADSLAEYRGHTVGFCNPQCRDDFLANGRSRLADEAFFDAILEGK